jgi:hypothetical protein
MKISAARSLPSPDTFWQRKSAAPGEEWSSASQEDEDLRTILRDCREGVTPRYVSDLWSNANLRPAVVATAVWGWPTKNRGRIPHVLSQASTIGRVTIALREEPLGCANVALRVLSGFRQVGPSMASKLMFLSGMSHDGMPCLIFDQRVVRSIAHLNEPEFHDLQAAAAKALSNNSHVESHINAFQSGRYAEFLASVAKAAKRLKCQPLQIEQFLFLRGGATGKE